MKIDFVLTCTIIVVINAEVIHAVLVNALVVALPQSLDTEATGSFKNICVVQNKAHDFKNH